MSQHYTYKTAGTCSQKIDIELADDGETIESVALFILSEQIIK